MRIFSGLKHQLGELLETFQIGMDEFETDTARIGAAHLAGENDGWLAVTGRQREFSSASGFRGMFDRNRQKRATKTDVARLTLKPDVVSEHQNRRKPNGATGVTPPAGGGLPAAGLVCQAACPLAVAAPAHTVVGKTRLHHRFRFVHVA